MPDPIDKKEQLSNEQKTVPSPSFTRGETESRPEPKIRTMQSDVQSLFREGRETLTSAVSKEVMSKKYPSAEMHGIEKKSRMPFIMLVVGIVLAAAIGGSIYIGFFFRKTSEVQTPVEQAVIPRPFFAMEKSRNVILPASSFADFPQNLTIVENDPERAGIVKRIVILIREHDDRERLATVEEFFRAAHVTPAKALIETTAHDFNFFLIYQKGAVRRGVVLPITNDLRAFRAMIDAESTLRNSWSGLYAAKDPMGTIAAFEDITYRNIDIRRTALSSTGDIGLYYAVFKPKKYLIVTTSYEAMKLVLDRILESF